MNFTHFDAQGNAVMVDVGENQKQSGKLWHVEL